MEFLSQNPTFDIFSRSEHIKYPKTRINNYFNQITPNSVQIRVQVKMAFQLHHTFLYLFNLVLTESYAQEVV